MRNSRLSGPVKKRHSSQIMNWLESNGKSTRVKKNGRGSKQRTSIEVEEGKENKKAQSENLVPHQIVDYFFCFLPNKSE